MIGAANRAWELAVKRKALLMLVGAVAVAGAALNAALRPRPARIAATARVGDDTVVVNQMQRTRLSASVLDQYGRRFGVDTVMRYQWMSGDSIGLSPDGVLQCTRRSSATVRATAHRLVKDFTVRCRPVAWVEAVTWADLVVGDSAQDLSFVAHGPDGRTVTELRGTVVVENSSIVEASGTSIRAKRPGWTSVTIQVGDARTHIPVMVYHEVESFVGNPRGMDLMAMHVKLARGDTIVVPVPKAAFWVTYFSQDRRAAPPTIELKGDGSCADGNGLRLRRMEEGKYAKYCRTGVGAQMMIAHGSVGTPIVSGVVAVRVMW
jgi:hypothetical protein